MRPPLSAVGKKHRRRACVKGKKVPYFYGIWVEPRRIYSFVPDFRGEAYLFLEEFL